MDVDLVSYVEEGGGFVEEHGGGLLGERAGDDDALFFAAADFGDESVGELRDVRGAHGLVGYVNVLAVFERKGAEVGIAAHQDDFADGEGEEDV